MTIWLTCCCNADIAVNEMSCAASVVPIRMPVSWSGKKPLGIAT